jgi:hypothetical protein
MLLQHASRINKVFSEFLSRQLPPPTVQSHHNTEVLGRTGLRILAGLRHDPTIESRNPALTSSFSILSDAECAERLGMQQVFSSGEESALRLVSEEGLPIRL